jgi:hypothetical protein
LVSTNRNRAGEVRRTQQIVTVQQLLQFHQHVTDRAYKLMAEKNHDYTAASEDPFNNFREFGDSIGELGIAIRMSDKWRRFRTFIKKGMLKVKEEKVEDTLIDLINYAIIWMAYRRRRKLDL